MLHDNFIMSVMTVSSSLAMVGTTPALISIIDANKEAWVSFGKKNSHILRTILFKLFASSSLSKESIFWIFFFHSLIKDKDRIINAIDIQDESVKGNEAVKEAVKFMKTKMVKYVKDESMGKFASVHLPTTNPGLDILCFLMSMGVVSEQKAKSMAMDTVKEIMARNTMTQIALNQEAQTLNKEKVKHFWDNVVIFKDAEERKKNKVPVHFVEEFYETAARDNYSLLTRDFKELSIPSGGYSLEFIKTYVFYILANRKFNGSKPVMSPKDDKNTKDKSKDEEEDVSELEEAEENM